MVTGLDPSHPSHQALHRAQDQALPEEPHQGRDRDHDGQNPGQPGEQVALQGRDDILHGHRRRDQHHRPSTNIHRLQGTQPGRLFARRPIDAPAASIQHGLPQHQIGQRLPDRRRPDAAGAQHHARRVHEVRTDSGRGALSGNVTGQRGKVQRRVHDCRHMAAVGRHRPGQHDRWSPGDPANLVGAKHRLPVAKGLAKIFAVAQIEALSVPGRLTDQTTVRSDQSDVEHPRLQCTQPTEIARATLAVLSHHRRRLGYRHEKLPDPVQPGPMLARQSPRQRIKLIA